MMRLLLISILLVSCDLEIPVLVGTLSSNSSDVTISWISPTTNSDGSPLTDLASFRLYQGEESGRYLLEEILPGVPHKTVTLQPGRHFFSVTAIDYSGNESEKSEELEIIVQ